MASLLPMLEWQQTAPSTADKGRSNKTSLQAHFPGAPAFGKNDGPVGGSDAEYRKQALKLLLTDETYVTEDGASPTANSYWVADEYRRDFSVNGISSYSEVPLSNVKPGNPESPFYPNRSSAPDADPSQMPAGTPVSAADAVASNDLASVRVAGSAGPVTARDPKTASRNSSITAEDIDNGKTRSLGNSTATSRGGTQYGE